MPPPTFAEVKNSIPYSYTLAETTRCMDAVWSRRLDAWSGMLSVGCHSLRLSVLRPSRTLTCLPSLCIWPWPLTMHHSARAGFKNIMNAAC